MNYAPHEQRLVDLPGTLTHETDAAYLFRVSHTKVWLPKSQCQWDQPEQVMTMPERLAIERELV